MILFYAGMCYMGFWWEHRTWSSCFTLLTQQTTKTTKITSFTVSRLLTGSFLFLSTFQQKCTRPVIFLFSEGLQCIRTKKKPHKSWKYYFAQNKMEVQVLNKEKTSKMKLLNGFLTYLCLKSRLILTVIPSV